MKVKRGMTLSLVVLFVIFLGMGGFALATHAAPALADGYFSFGRTGRFVSSYRSQQSYTLSGRVYDGQTGLEPPNSTPIQGVTVSLYCSANQSQQGTLLTSTTTDVNGWYGLDTSAVCEYYNIIETDPGGYTSNGATTVGGSVITANWIEYAGSLDNKTLTGNKFWDQGPATNTPTPTSPPPTATPTATSPAGVTNTPTPTPTSPPASTATPTPTSPAGATNTPTSTPTATSGPPGTADLSISKTFSVAEPVAPGSYGYYRLRVENNGPATATNVVFTDTLPAEFAFDYGATMCTKVASRPPNDVVRCTLNFVSPTFPNELVLYGTVDNDACGKMTNVAKVSSDTPDPNSHNNYTKLDTIVGPCDRPAVAIRKRVVDPPNGMAAPKDIITFAIDIFNIGNQPLTSVPLKDTFDSQHLAYVGASPQPDHLAAASGHGIMRWQNLVGAAPHGFGHPLVPGDHFTVMVRLQAKAAGWGSNCAEVNTVVDNIPLHDKSCTGAFIRRPGVDLIINKRVVAPSGGVAVVGQTAEFRISVENVGSEPITGLHLQDIYDKAVLSFYQADLPPDDSNDDGTLDWSNLIAQLGHPLLPGTTVSFSIRFRAVRPTLLGHPTRNCIHAQYNHNQGPVLEVPHRCAPLQVREEGGPVLVVQKILYVPASGEARPGETIKFSFVITNTGTTTLTNVALTDLYDVACLRFVPTGWPPSWKLDPDDPADDGALHWSNYIVSWGGTMPPGSWQITWPGVQFEAKAGSGCDPTVNRIEVVATDQGGQHAQATSEAAVRIINEPAPGAYRIFMPIAMKPAIFCRLR